MRALKVLNEGGVGIFSQARWPAPGADGPGAWVEADLDAQACVRGVHACGVDQLPFWLGPELYVIELGGEVTRGERKLVAARGRLLRRIDAWTPEKARAFAAASLMHALEVAGSILRAEGEARIADALAGTGDVDAIAPLIAGPPPAPERGRLVLEYVADALRHLDEAPAASAYCSAHVGLDERGYVEARAWQARWLDEELGLGAMLAPG
jgi:hypothetical protein